MKWEELGPLLRQSHTQLYHSFTRGIRSWNRRSAAAEKDSDNDGGIIVTNDKDDGFRAVGRGRKGRRAFRDLLSDDWLRGSPDADWRLRRLAGQQAGRAAMAGRYACGAYALSSVREFVKKVIYDVYLPWFTTCCRTSLLKIS